MQAKDPTTLMRDGIAQITALRHDASESHIAEHIRGMVSATMGNLSTRARDSSESDAKHWQEWALGIADSLTPPVALPPGN